MEEWVTIEEFPAYAVSSDGYVINRSRDRFMSTSRNTNGIIKVGLVKEGKQYTRAVGVLVAEAFVNGHDEIYDTVIYLDGDRSNVRAENLMWRPRWFALEYQNQFLNESQNDYIGPLRAITSGEVYTDVYQAGVIHGLLFKDIRLALTSKETVFPTFLRFELI